VTPLLVDKCVVAVIVKELQRPLVFMEDLCRSVLVRTNRVLPKPAASTSPGNLPDSWAFKPRELETWGVQRGYNQHFNSPPVIIMSDQV
jgi:hypothetical protein